MARYDGGLLLCFGGQPFAGQSRIDLALNLRFFPAGTYLIFYRPIEDGVEIVRVIHGSRDYRDERF